MKFLNLKSSIFTQQIEKQHIKAKIHTLLSTENRNHITKSCRNRTHSGINRQNIRSEEG